MNKINTGFKFFLLIALSSIVLAFKNYLFLTSVLLAVLFISPFINVKNKLFSRLKLLIPTSILIFVFQILFNQSPTFLDKLAFSYLVFSKILIISVLVLYFVATTSLSSIISFLSFLPEDIKLMLTMTFYFIPLIFDEAKYISLVQKSRGLRNSSFNIAPLIVPLLHRVFVRAQALSLAIVSRGY